MKKMLCIAMTCLLLFCTCLTGCSKGTMEYARIYEANGFERGKLLRTVTNSKEDEPFFYMLSYLLDTGEGKYMDSQGKTIKEMPEDPKYILELVDNQDNTRNTIVYLWYTRKESLQKWYSEKNRIIFQFGEYENEDLKAFFDDTLYISSKKDYQKFYSMMEGAFDTE